ncbi:MAG: SprB repeat-containing protein, partial [Bacteroidota bacterium]
AVTGVITVGNPCGNGSSATNLTFSGFITTQTGNWNTGATAQNISNLASGNYTVTVTDANGCVANLVQTITQPSGSLTASLSASQNVSCYGGINGSISLNITGGTTPYSYSWSNGSSVQNISNLSSGSYTVTVTDANNCVTNLTQIISQPSGSISASLSASQNVSCYGGVNGSISLNVIGGTTPYSYSWSNGAVTQNINNLSSGSYTVTVTDANSCVTNLTQTISQPSGSLSASLSASQNVSCYGGVNGSIALNVIGGSAPYSYNWSNGANTQNISNLSSGSYTVTVTDANNCVTSLTQTISQPSGSLSASLSASQNVSCYGGVNGSISLNVIGGTAPYSYNWSNGAVSQNINNLSSGAYTVTVTDANGCSANYAKTITQPSNALSASSSASQNVSCNSGANGAIVLNITGGTAPYSYNWSNGATTQNISGLFAGNYIVTVIDANGCYANQSQTVTQPIGSLSSNVSSASNVSCNGGNNGTINLNVSGGTIPYSYNWSNGATTQNLNGIAAGNYAVIVTDANGCSTVNSGITVSQPPIAL